MKVLSARSDLLTNAEVLPVLKALRGEGKHGRDAEKTLATLIYQSTKYLHHTAPTPRPSGAQSAALLEHAAKIGLTKAEVLQILNLRPVTAVEVQLIVEESEERLDEEAVEALIEVIKANVPEPPPPDAKAAPKSPDKKHKK